MQQLYVNTVTIRTTLIALIILRSWETFVKNYFLQLKESLLILKLKLSLNDVAKESMPLYLFDNDS